MEVAGDPNLGQGDLNGRLSIRNIERENELDIRSVKDAQKSPVHIWEKAQVQKQESLLKIYLCQTIPTMLSVSSVPPQLPMLNDLLRRSSFHQVGQMGSD